MPRSLSGCSGPPLHLRRATHTQSLPDWIAVHQRMLPFFGGVPVLLLVPDNLKAAVTRPAAMHRRSTPPIPSLAAHYGTAVLPARTYVAQATRPRRQVAVPGGGALDTARCGIAFFSLAELMPHRWLAAALQGRTESRSRGPGPACDLVKDFGTSESPKSTRSSTTHWCPGRPGHPAFRHNIASSLRLHTGLPYDWTPRSDAPLGSPFAPSARRVSRVASRLPGTTRLRFALHGGQRWSCASPPPPSR